MIIEGFTIIFSTYDDDFIQPTPKIGVVTFDRKMTSFYQSENIIAL